MIYVYILLRRLYPHCDIEWIIVSYQSQLTIILSCVLALHYQESYRTKWPTFSKRHIQMHFFKCDELFFYSKFGPKNFVLKVQLTLSQRWFRLWHGTEQARYFINNSVDNDQTHSCVGNQCKGIFFLNFSRANAPGYCQCNLAIMSNFFHANPSINSSRPSDAYMRR